MSTCSPRVGGLFVMSALAVIALGAPAQAAEPKVQVVAEAVHASNTGNSIDPPSLAKLKLGGFTNIRRLSQATLTVEKEKPAEFKLPDGKVVTIRLLGVNNGVASFNISLPQKGARPAEVKYEAGKEPLTIATSQYQGGVLFLVLSPPGEAQPRRLVRPSTRSVSASGVTRPALLPRSR